MLVGISTKEISSENSIKCYNYTIECNLFCIAFFIDTKHYYEPATWDEPEHGDIDFDWDSFDLDKKHKIDEQDFELAMNWIDDHHEELESALSKGYIEIETECK